MSSLFDVPVHLAMVLALAVSGVEGGDARPHEPEPRQFTSVKPYYFSEQTWLEALHSGAGGTELSHYQSAIFRTGSKRYYVPRVAYRTKVLALRRDLDIAALVAFNFARQNAKLLSSQLARPVTPADLYVVHVLGRDAALPLVAASERNPIAPVTTVLPRLSAIGPALLGKKRRPMTVIEFYGRLTRAFAATKAKLAEPMQTASKNPAPAIPKSPPKDASLRGGLIDLRSSAWIPLKSHLVWATEIAAVP